ncbi:MAG: hypothetical protein IJW64_00480 [Clostridia bacterium]|nr:hypothetical protein [Clostridia bacterium]
MKYQVEYGSFVKHRVSCNSKSEVSYCQRTLKAQGIASKVIDVSLLSSREKATLTKSDFSFQRFKKEILK